MFVWAQECSSGVYCCFVFTNCPKKKEKKEEDRLSKTMVFKLSKAA
jgi:hypothetical protein